VEDEHALDSTRLAVMDGPALQALLGRKSPMPLQDERARLLREVRMLHRGHIELAQSSIS